MRCCKLSHVGIVSLSKGAASAFMKTFTSDERYLQFLKSPRTEQVFYLAYLFHFVLSMSTVTGTSPPTFIRKARGLDCMLCNVASYSSKWKNILESFWLIGWKKLRFLLLRSFGKLQLRYFCALMALRLSSQQ